MVYTYSLPPLTPNEPSVEEFNMKYVTMIEGVAKQIPDLAQTIASISKLPSKLAPKHSQNVFCSLNNSVKNRNREGLSHPIMSAASSSLGKAERKHKGNECYN